MTKPSPQADFVADILAARPEWRTLPKKSFATWLCDTYPGRFENVEVARGVVRRVLGANQGVNSKKYAHLAVEHGHQSDRLPKAVNVEYVPYEVEGDANILLLSDIHLPYHDDVALEAAINFGLEYDPTHILLLGDLLDCHQVSDHEKDADAVTMLREFEIANEFLDYLQDKFPSAKIIYKEGNHEERLPRYLTRNAEALQGLISIPKALNLEERGIDWVADKREILCGKLVVLHGHEIAGRWGVGVNPARTAFLKLVTHAMIGHVHRTTEYMQRIYDSTIACYSVGCLCSLSPRYARFNQWNHGFATIDKQACGKFRVRQLRIVDGDIY